MNLHSGETKHNNTVGYIGYSTKQSTVASTRTAQTFHTAQSYRTAQTPKSLSFYNESRFGCAEPEELRPNGPHLMRFMITMILSGVTLGYTDYSNQAAALYNV